MRRHYQRTTSWIIAVSIVASVLVMGNGVKVAANGHVQGDTTLIIPRGLPKITAENAHLLQPVTKLGHGTPQNLRWTADGSRLIVISFSSIWIYDADDFSEPIQHLTLSGDFHRIVDADLSPDGNFAIVAEYLRVQLLDITGDNDPILLTEFPDVLREVAIAYSPDGRVAYGTPEFTVHLRRVETEETLVFEGHSAIIRSLAFSPDGLLMVTASEDGTARLWNTQNGQEIQQFTLGGTAVVSVALSPNSDLLAVSGGRGLEEAYNPNDIIEYPLGVFDLISNEQILSVTTILTPNALSFSADGRRLALSSTTTTALPSPNGQLLPVKVTLFDLEMGTSFEAPTDDGARQARFSPRGDLMAIISPSGPQVLNTSDFAVQTTLPYFGWIRFVDFDVDANLMMWQAGYSTQVVDLETGLPVADFMEMSGRQFSRSGEVIGITPTNHIQWVDVSTQVVTDEFEADGTVVGLVESKDGERWLIGTGEGHITVWDIEDNQIIFEGFLQPARWGSLRFADDEQLVIHHAYGNISIWDIESGTLLQNMSGLGTSAISPDGRIIAYQEQGETIVKVADTRTGEIMAEFPILTGAGSAIDFNHAGTWMTIASSNYLGGDGAFHVIDVTTLEEIAIYDFKGFPWSARFSPDDTMMILYGESEALTKPVVELWNLESGEIISTLQDITGASSIRFNADQTLLITGAGTSPPYVIDTQSGEVLSVLRGQGSGATDYWFSPNETFIASAAADGTVWLWGVVE